MVEFLIRCIYTQNAAVRFLCVQISKSSFIFHITVISSFRKPFLQQPLCICSDNDFHGNKVEKLAFSGSVLSHLRDHITKTANQVGQTWFFWEGFLEFGTNKQVHSGSKILNFYIYIFKCQCVFPRHFGSLSPVSCLNCMLRFCSKLSLIVIDGWRIVLCKSIYVSFIYFAEAFSASMHFIRVWCHRPTSRRKVIRSLHTLPNEILKVLDFLNLFPTFLLVKKKKKKLMFTWDDKAMPCFAMGKCCGGSFALHIFLYLDQKFTFESYLIKASSSVWLQHALWQNFKLGEWLSFLSEGFVFSTLEIWIVHG